MAPKVLIADDLSPAAVAIFKERGIETDVKVGLSKDELEKIIGQYDGLAVRSATKVTSKVLEGAGKLKVIGRETVTADGVAIGVCFFVTGLFKKSVAPSSNACNLVGSSVAAVKNSTGRCERAKSHRIDSKT